MERKKNLSKKGKQTRTTQKYTSRGCLKELSTVKKKIAKSL